MKEERKSKISGSKEKSTSQEPEYTTATADDSIQPELLATDVEDHAKDFNNVMENLRRVQADFVNYKHRAEEEREDQQRFANTRLILKLLPVIDDFNLAINHASDSEAAAQWLDGIKLIHRKLISLVESENATKIEVDGREFNPTEHEAMAYQESADHRQGEILSVVRDGYKLKSRVIRPALVILAKEPEAAETKISTSVGKEPEDA